ncbi:MAG TPA: FixH family protein [Candidatus Methylomirabilis sp.]|nr:FixH family protein [Candidatus Methylomirabilis sp.]
MGEWTSIERGMVSGAPEKRRLKSTLVSWISLLGLGVVIVIALIKSLSPPRGPQSLGEASLAIRSDPDPPRLGPNRLEVRLATRDGKPISDARLDLKYGPEAMGTLSIAPMQASGEGVYRSDVEFDAPGAWKVILTLKRQGASDLSTDYIYNVAPSSKGGKVLAGTVRIAPALGGKVGRGDVLFVIARKGPGPPLAVKRIANPTFPVSFRLGAEDMPMGGGQFEGEVSVTARVKKGGGAGPAQRGDLEGAYPGNPVKIGGSPIEIVIDREA